MILFAVLSTALLLVMGVAIQGGRVFVEYQRLQNAADMAALIGAQKLPCNTTDTSCISSAESQACTYASLNGGYSCTGGGSGSNFSAVPPSTCSPYSFLTYQSSNANCPASGQDNYNFIEVQLQKSLSIPIFNIPITLSTHAVARRGQASARDYALMVLDPSMSGALTLSGSQSGGLVLVGDTVVDSSSSSAVITNGQSTHTACSSSWFVTGAEPVPPAGAANKLSSDTGGTTAFSPPLCFGGSTDSPTRFSPNQEPVPDPYASSVAPTSSTLSNCSACQGMGEVYQWDSDASLGCGGSSRTDQSGHGNNWYSADKLHNINGGNGINGGCYEFFPGVYPGEVKITGGTVYLNPGVYTIEAGWDQTGGSICIFGAPACDHLISNVNSNDNCSTATFSNSQGVGTANYVSSGDWYYYCSPYGFWDPDVTKLGKSSANPFSSNAAPTFTNSTTPLNGVTFYLPDPGSANSDWINMNGNGGSYLAAPNPCPGTGTSSGDPIPFTIEGTPSGSSTGVYSSYPTSGQNASPLYADSLKGWGTTLASPAGEVYPSADMRVAGETAATCAAVQPPTPATAWSGEFGSTANGQHLNFLVWTRSSYVPVTLNGGGTQNWWGIVYDPGNYASGGGCAAQCQVALVGGAGGTGLGPPLLVGQVIADNASFSGSASFEIFYRSCAENGYTCNYGTGTSLVQ